MLFLRAIADVVFFVSTFEGNKPNIFVLTFTFNFFLGSTDLLPSSFLSPRFWNIIKWFRINFCLLFMNQHVAAIKNRVQVLYLLMIEILLVTVHVFYFIQGFFSDILVKHASLVLLFMDLHLPLYLPEQLINSFLLLASQKRLVFVKELLLCLDFAHPSLRSSL